MAKQNKKHRLNIHPVHFHFGMYLALAAILVTAAKSSGEMIRTLYAVPVHDTVVSDTHLREAETLHGQANTGMARRAYVASQ